MKFFESIDNYFDNKSKKEFVYALILIVFLIGFLIYYFIYPKVLNYKNSQESNFKNLTSQLQQLNISLNVLKARISVLDRNIKQKNNILVTLNKKLMFYNELANLLDFAEFDQYKWANLVKNTVIDAKNKGMIVKDVQNHIYDINTTKKSIMPQIVKRMDIGIELEGKYKNFIYYLYDYENRKELIRVKDMKITSPSTFYVEFSIYGYDR